MTVINLDDYRKKAEPKPVIDNYPYQNHGTAGERLVRIRESIEKINRLMASLRRISKEENR